MGVLDSVTDEDIYDEKENPMQGTTLDSVTDDDLYGDNSSDSSSDSFEENPLDSVSDEDIYGGEKPLTPQETYRREVMAETFKEGKQLYDQAITEISTISNKTAPDDSSQTTREKDSSFTGNNPSIIEMNQYLNSFSEDERGYYNSKTQGKPDYEKLDFARKMHEKKKEVLNPKEKPKEKTKEKPKENEFVTAVKHLPSNLKEGFGQLKQSIQYKVSDFMKPKELKRQEAETALEASDPRNVQFTKQPKNEKRYENMDSLIADMHDKGELSDREAWDYYQEGAAREKKYAPWHEKGAATVVGLISYANPITAVAGIASQYKANLDKTGNKQQAADALVIDLTTYSAFVGAGKLWRYGKQKMIGSKVSEPLSDLVRDSGRITTEVSLPEYKKLKLKVETGKASSVEMQTLKNINEAIERDYGGKFMDVLKNKRKIKVKAVIPEEIVADIKPVKVKPIIKPKPITVFRGEGGNNKFQGRSTFVAGKNFATDKARASTFGNVKEYIVPSTAKVLKINTVGKELKDTAKELNIPYNVFLDPKKLNKELRKQGYDVLQTTERLGVGGKITKDSPIVTDIIELTPGILKEQVKPEVKPEVKPTKPIAKVVKTEIKPEVNKNSKRTATRRGIGEIIKAEDSLLIDYSIAEEMGLAKPIGKDIVFPPDRAEVLVKDFMPESIGKKITNNDSEIYINKKEVEVKKSEALITDEVEIVKEAVNSAKGTGVRIRTEDGEWMGIPSERPKGLIGKPITKATLRVEAIDRLENGTKDVPADPDYLISTKQYEKADKAIDRWQSMIMDREDYTDAKEMLKNATIEGKPKLYIDSYNQMKERVDLYDTYENKRSKAKKVETLSSKVQKQKVSPKEEVLASYSVPKESLIQEAKKYKSADEFIKAKEKDIVYHGSNEALEKFDDTGAFFTDDMMNADGYGSGENVYEGYLNMKNPLVIDAKGRHHSDLKTPYGTTTQEVVGTVDYKKYDGVIFKNINDSFADDVEGVGTDTIFYPFNANKSFLNKQQLTDIYNQAQKKEFASLSKEETKKMVEVKRVQLKTTSQIERIKQKKELKIKQSELKEAKKPAESIKDFTRERRALIDLKSYETNLFLDPIEKSLSQEQREIIPFLIEKTEIPEKLGRKDLVKTYNQYKNDPAMLKIVKDIKDHFDKGWDYLQKNTDKMDVAQIEDYVTHIWQVSKKQKGVVSSWFNTRNKFLKKRYIATLKEGIDKFDLKPLVLDITEIIRIHDSIMNKVIANNNFVDKLKQANKAADVPFMARADLAPDDWVTMDNPAMTENVIIPRDAKLGEKITPELENLLAEMGVAIGRRISPVAFGKPVSKQGSYSTGKIPEIRLQRFFESRTLTHEIGHHLDKTLGLGDKFFNKFVNELFEVNKERIEILKAAGKERYATSPEEQIAEFFALFFTNPKEAIKVAPGATTYVMDLLKKDGQLTKLVDFDFENKAKILIEEQMNTMFKLPLKVHPDVYKPLNVIFGQRIRQPIIQAYEMVNGLLKKATLSLSLFHHGALTETGISIMGPAKTLKLANPFSYIYKGVIKGENVAFKETELAVDAIEHGLQLGASSDIPVQKIQKAMNELAFKSKDKFLVGKLTQYLATFNQKWDAALWNYLHDGLKLYGYEHLVGTMTKKVTTAKEMTMAKREIAQFVNDTFGGQNWDLLGVDPKTQQLATWGLLSFDWTVSTVRQALSPTGLGGIYKDNKTLRKKMGAIFWFKTFLYFGVGINSLNKMFREKDRKENPKYYRGEKRTVWSGTMFDNTVGHQTHLFIGRNKDGTERYRRWGKQFRELPELFWDYGEFSPISASIKKIGGKAAPLAQLTSEILTGHSLSGFKNRDIADKRGWDRVWGITKRIAKSPLPFSTRTIFDENSEFHVLDLMMPASKGFSKYKAINLFKQAILKKDNQRVKEIFNASQRNDLDAYGLYKTALTIVKSENSKTLKRDVKSADEAKKRFKTAKTIADKKVYARIYKTYRKENIQKEKIDLFFDRAIKELDVYHKTIKEQ